MKITSIDLRAFRSFVDTTLDTKAPRILIVGQNGTGKTSVREALKFILTGQAQGLNGNGHGTEVLIPTGHDRVHATLHLVTSSGQNNSLDVTRGWLHGVNIFSVETFTGTAQAQQEALYETLETTEPFLQAVLDSTAFLNMHHAEAKKMILGVLDIKVPIEGQALTLDDLDLLYKSLFDQRRAAKTKARGHIVPRKPEGHFPSLESIQLRLTELREQLNDLNRNFGETAGRRMELLRRIDQMPLGTERVPGLPLDIVLERIVETEERLAIMESEATEDVLSEQTDPWIGPVDEFEANRKALTVLRSRAEAIETHRPALGCVLDKHIRCDTPKMTFRKRGKQLADDAAVLEAQLPKGPIGVVSAPPSKADSPITLLRKELERLQRMQAEHEQAGTAATTHAEERRQLEAELQALPDISEQEAQITDIRARIQKGEGVLTSASFYFRQVGIWQEALDQQVALGKEIERLEALVELTGPNGARVKALASALGPFHDAVNRFTGAFGWEVVFNVEPWQVSVNGRPVETFSRSEQYRIGIAIQLAIAKLSGLGFAVVDELDLLDLTNRDKAGRMLYESDLEQIFILSTREPGTPLPKIPSMKVIRLAMSENLVSQVVEAI
jgi:hypothetical protein